MRWRRTSSRSGAASSWPSSAPEFRACSPRSGVTSTEVTGYPGTSQSGSAPDEDVLGRLDHELGGLAAGADEDALVGAGDGDGLAGQGADATQQAHQLLVLLH